MATPKIGAREIGIGAAAVAAAAIGAYWLYGAKNASTHRKAVRSWMLKARAEVLEAIEQMSEIDHESYLRLIDTVVKRYAAHVSPAELALFAADLRRSWQHLKPTHLKPAVAKKVQKTKTAAKRRMRR